MLDYKNKNWWAYDLGVKICLVIAIITVIIRIMNRKTLDGSSAFILENIQHIMLMIIFGLMGTEKVFVKNSKEGYSYYLVTFIMFLNLMVSNFFN